MSSDPIANGASSALHDFDFLIGTWTTHQRRLKSRLNGCQDWESFEASSQVLQLPGGVVNFDTLVAEAWRPGWVGMSMRVFNPVTNLWSIHWVTNEGAGIDPATGALSPPVVGRFEGDIGVFDGEEVIDGRPVRVRFRWQRLGPDRARWEQAFSDDGGERWEVNWVMDFERTGPVAAAPVTVPALDVECEVVELRRYLLQTGRRETLIDLFDREFVETQEALGMAVMGQFRELDAPDRFTWVRGFPDRARRVEGLTAFYGGPVWQRHREAANATMIDSGDVLLLKPAWPGSGIRMQGRCRAEGPVRLSRPGLVDLAVFHLHEPASGDLIAFCQEVMYGCLRDGGARCLGWYVTDDRPNDFARLPVREGEHVLVGLALFQDTASFEAWMSGRAWARRVQPLLSRWLRSPVERHRLVPTARSAIHA